MGDNTLEVSIVLLKLAIISSTDIYNISFDKGDLWLQKENEVTFISIYQTVAQNSRPVLRYIILV